MRTPSLIAWLTLTFVGGAVPAAAQYELEKAFPNLTFQYATDIQCPLAPPGAGRVFVVEKRGVITVFPELLGATPADQTLFLDISAKVRNFGEAGLVGLAFHPNYANNGYFFVYYVSLFPYRNIVARYKVSSNPNVADPGSELILFDEAKINTNHNGGQIAFGTGNLLYVAMGDDQNSANAQDLGNVLGSILRIAPNVSGSAPAYTIPDDNPFKGNALGYREEIFAYGFRNPWRFSIDPVSSDIWLADVGENDYEEVDILEIGGNYGWPYMEGPNCFSPSICDTAGRDLQLPLYAYDHTEGSAVIGGHVYHGARLPELDGLYVFADFDGNVWTLDYDGVTPPTRSDLVLNGPALLAFGVGNLPKRDLYVSSSNGYIYRLSRVVTGAGAPPNAGASRLLGNFPNPFNPSTTIRYQLDRPGRVAIEIVSVGGERVTLLDQGARRAGTFDAAWRGQTDAGGRAASGVYFYRLVVDGVARDTARMVLVQ